MRIKHLIYNYYKKRCPRQAAEYKSYDAVRSFFILYESDWLERNAEIKQMIRQIRDDGKSVVAWGYCDKKDIQAPNLPESRILGPKNMNLWDKPLPDVLQDLGRRQFDVLIDLTTQPLLPLQYIAMYAPAALRIGSRAEDGVYDMVIPMPADAAPEDLFKQIIHYIQLIKTAHD